MTHMQQAGSARVGWHDAQAEHSQTEPRVPHLAPAGVPGQAHAGVACVLHVVQLQEGVAALQAHRDEATAANKPAGQGQVSYCQP
jgi:hypothetical protein